MSLKSVGGMQVTHIKNQETAVKAQGLNDPHEISLPHHLPGSARHDLMMLPTTLFAIHWTGGVQQGSEK